MSEQKFDPVLIPILRNVMPAIIAEELCSVQPTSGNTSKGWVTLGEYMPEGKKLYSVRRLEIREWIESFDRTKWRTDDTHAFKVIDHCYLLSDELETLFLLRWS